MLNWKDRYPVACLEAVWEIYRKDMLKISKHNHMKRLGLLVLTILAGIVGGFMTNDILLCCIPEEKGAKRAPEKRRMAPSATV